MLRALPLCIIAMLAAPAHAGTERASVAVSLRVLPSCVAQTKEVANHGLPAPLQCSTQPLQNDSRAAPQPFYTVRAYRSADGTVVSYDF